MAGGLQKYTVQEGQNLGLGQAGSMFIVGGSGDTAIKPPTGRVFVGITFLSNTTFDSSNGMIAEDSNQFINTEVGAGADGSASGASGGLDVQQTNASFPAGVTIFGRWTELDPYSGTLIAYIG